MKSTSSVFIDIDKTDGCFEKSLHEKAIRVKNETHINRPWVSLAVYVKANRRTNLTYSFGLKNG